MHVHNLEQWQHSHDFLINQEKSEKKTQIVMILTAITMVVEIITGLLFGSIALLADGWHMATHVGAFAITLFTYRYARKNVNNPKFTFGTGKVNVLGGFASAVALGVIALVMALESGMRLFEPRPIYFNQAIAVAIIGLIVNLVSAWLLQDDHHHHDHHTHEHHHHQDHNLQAAYVHVLADALTSILAIVALFGGKIWGWIWLDAIMGFVGAGVITKWAYHLIKDTSSILLDGTADQKTRLAVINAIEGDADNRVVDLHLWYLSQNSVAVMISIVTHEMRSPNYYKNLLKHIPSLTHISVEVNPCEGEPCIKYDLSLV
ncbi:CDF family Co(II)/Ni(II) efflux transporter DmeF [Cyanobacterium sp. Dongsha4]|uniref:CDF family Co(II)/Ni(II) efflux transporter DmeF n=1 Tax=Cyanobacterium sp. DS4 TaxID=2878255 RepID=UPI002E809947|nr:CDF family Co(II)/Ni(II) efflux transporter DmeF [Cyanobacterium sp. Dongsha4]WVK99759.1 CDF family Co(II)/Ni(II) efflux transporter DmeF [Cyanobacterium sp. Dongsha4]